MFKAILPILIFLLAAPSIAEDNFNNPLVNAANNGQIQLVDAYLNSGYYVNARGDYGVTSLMRAIYNNHLDVAKLLLEKGADPDATDLGGATAIMIAARKGNLPAIELLLQYGASLNELDENGRSPLMKAVINRHYGVIEFLLAKGADPYLEDREGKDSIILASEQNDPELNKLFVSYLPATIETKIDPVTVEDKNIVRADPPKSQQTSNELIGEKINGFMAEFSDSAKKLGNYIKGLPNYIVITPITEDEVKKSANQLVQKNTVETKDGSILLEEAQKQADLQNKEVQIIDLNRDVTDKQAMIAAKDQAIEQKSKEASVPSIVPPALGVVEERTNLVMAEQLVINQQPKVQASQRVAQNMARTSNRLSFFDEGKKKMRKKEREVGDLSKNLQRDMILARANQKLSIEEVSRPVVPPALGVVEERTNLVMAEQLVINKQPKVQSSQSVAQNMAETSNRLRFFDEGKKKMRKKEREVGDLSKNLQRDMILARANQKLSIEEVSRPVVPPALGVVEERTMAEPSTISEDSLAEAENLEALSTERIASQAICSQPRPKDTIPPILQEVELPVNRVEEVEVEQKIPAIIISSFPSKAKLFMVKNSIDKHPSLQHLNTQITTNSELYISNFQDLQAAEDLCKEIATMSLNCRVH